MQYTVVKHIFQWLSTTSLSHLIYERRKQPKDLFMVIP